MGWNSLHQLGMEVNRVGDINDAIYKLGVIVGEKTDLVSFLLNLQNFQFILNHHVFN